MPALSSATWQFELADLNLVRKAFLSKPGVGAYTRRRRSYSEIRVEIEDPEDVAALEAAAYTRALRAWRNGVNRFNGPVVDVEETARGLTIVAKDPYYNMAWRRIRAAVTYSGISDGAIVAALLALQNSYRATGLRAGPADATLTRSGTAAYEAGERLDEKIEYLARYADGFDFTIDAVAAVAGVLAELTIVRPSGVLKPKARFEFGPGTRGTIDDYARRSRQKINRRSAIGERGDVATYEDATSITAHGLWEDERGHVTTDNDVALALVAAEGITPDIRYDLSVAPSPEAPQLFTDFDVVNTVPVLIRRRGITRVNGNLAIEEATVAFDANSGVELLDELVLELPV